MPSKAILRNHGFKNVATVAEYARCHPLLLPNNTYKPINDTEDPLEDPTIANQRVEAIVVLETPTGTACWIRPFSDRLVCEKLSRPCCRLARGSPGDLRPHGKQRIHRPAVSPRKAGHPPVLLQL